MWEIKLKVTNEQRKIKQKLIDTDNHMMERGWGVVKGKGCQKYGDGR